MAKKEEARKGGKSDKKAEIKVLARNKKARHDYAIDEIIEAGIALAGSEVKSIRAGKATLVDAFADVDGRGELWLCEVDIGSWAWAHARGHEARRRRKLLLHRAEIDRLVGKVRQKGHTLVPLSLYDKGGKIKVELALVHGKQEYDRRQDIRSRESAREMERAMKRGR